MVLSLLEAESLRFTLHSRGDASLSECGNPSSIALHLLHSDGGTILPLCERQALNRFNHHHLVHPIFILVIKLISFSP